MKWYVEFKVPNMTGDKSHRQGPYTESQIQSQYDDVLTYAGVTECRTVDVEATDINLQEELVRET